MKDYLKINAARDNKYLKNLAQHISLMEQQGLYPREFQMPVTLQFELVAECNLRCKHCYNRSGEGHSETRLKIDDWLALAQDLRRHGGIFQCILSGGEPLLLGNDLFTLMDALDADGTSFVIISNGYLLTAEKAARLAKYRYYWFQISIDGDTPELHDEFRQVTGSFSKAVAGAMHVAHMGVPLVIAHTVTPKTLPRLEYMADLAFRLGAASLMVGQVLPSGRANRYAAEISLSAEQENELYGRLENLQQTYAGKMEIQRSSGLKTQLERYRIGPNLGAIIRPNGDVRLDCMAPFVIGNVLEESFYDIWQRKGKHIWEHPKVLEFIQSVPEGRNEGNIKNYIDADIRL